MRSEKDIRIIVDRVREEMIYIGPDHPYYPLLAELVSAIPEVWQQGYSSHRVGSPSTNPYL